MNKTLELSVGLHKAHYNFALNLKFVHHHGLDAGKSQGVGPVGVFLPKFSTKVALNYNFFQITKENVLGFSSRN